MKIRTPLAAASIFFLVTLVTPTEVLAVVQSLNSQTGQTQTFQNDSKNESKARRHWLLVRLWVGRDRLDHAWPRRTCWHKTTRLFWPKDCKLGRQEFDSRESTSCAESPAQAYVVQKNFKVTASCQHCNELAFKLKYFPMTPVPKKKHTRGRSNRRRTANYKLDLPNMVKCVKCGKLRFSHTACPNCGFYK